MKVKCIKCIICHWVRRTGLERFSNVFFDLLQKSLQNYPATSHCLSTCGDLVEIWVIFGCFHLKKIIRVLYWSVLSCDFSLCLVCSLKKHLVHKHILERSLNSTSVDRIEKAFYRYLSSSNWRWQWFSSSASFPSVCLFRPNIPHFFS